MKAIALDKMSVKELRDLSDRISAAISARQARDRAELKQKIAQLAKEQGLTLADVLGGPRKSGRVGAKGRKGSAEIKYRDPSNPDNTWTGRGRRPKWLNGVANIEKFRIS